MAGGASHPDRDTRPLLQASRNLVGAALRRDGPQSGPYPLKP
ncbi:protein of unknown function [Pseudomonas sp. JV551A1]|nr:protein of unknown function [Pseudomonas sp. JV551A1]